MLTGTSPFSGDIVNILSDIISREPEHPCNISKSIKRSTGDAIMKALSKEKNNRYLDISAFRDDLLDM